MEYHLVNAVQKDVTGETCYDCGQAFEPDRLPPDGFVGRFEPVFFSCPDHNRGYGGYIDCQPDNPMDRKKLRRRIEDALRKTATDHELVRIAGILKVTI